MKITVKYSDYKNLYQGFQTSQSNYNADKKTIDIEIEESKFKTIEFMNNNKPLLNELNATGIKNPMAYINIGSAKIESQMNANLSKFNENQLNQSKNIITILKKYGF
jgi:hypothetical protein